MQRLDYLARLLTACWRSCPMHALHAGALPPAAQFPSCTALTTNVYCVSCSFGGDGTHVCLASGTPCSVRLYLCALRAYEC